MPWAIVMAVLMHLHVDVEPTKANGTAWDIGSDADPEAVVHVDGRQVGSCKADDTTALDCELTLDLDLAKLPELELDVRDRDVMNDDTIGRASRGLSPDDPRDTDLTMEPEGRVHAAWVRIGDPPGSRAALWAMIAVGSVCSMALVGGVLYWRARRRRVVVELAPAHGPFRCAHCGALYREGDVTCDRCGAPK